ncbi:AMMECR1 domain-containing protein [Pyrenochaeta sp. MPI-SDFR-AT-0127]|nr:AMMECR1 domain-containing protein [Pyrenochaeta sp. MPI-SDFR-AT-0127]
MATQAHCAYCFESLSASLEKRPALTLRQIDALWKKFNADPTTSEALDPQEIPETDNNVPPSPTSTDPSYKPAAVSRLLATSPSTGSSSSVQSANSTPASGVSEASSATSKNSSRSSFFSRLRKAEKETVEDHPLFVTWNTVSKSGERRLRGCIGTFEAQELDEGLRSYALTSAFDDTRFSPITARELTTLECAVTLLTDFEPASSPLDWSIGTHGLRISFTYHGRRYGSTYLPDVAREQGWTKEETLVSLMRKAGWGGRKDDWKKVELTVVRYQGKKVALEYREWKEWRDWVEEEMADC